MNFFIEMIPPTTTAQEHRVRIINGRPIFFDPPKVKEAKAMLTEHLNPHRPDTPFEGPIGLTTLWYFPKGKSHKDCEWRITRPDTDNLQKILKDCMTKLGFWHDDAQVCFEHIEKLWSSDPTGIFIDIKELDK